MFNGKPTEPGYYWVWKEYNDGGEIILLHENGKYWVFGTGFQFNMNTSKITKFKPIKWADESGETLQYFVVLDNSLKDFVISMNKSAELGYRAVPGTFSMDSPYYVLMEKNNHVD